MPLYAVTRTEDLVESTQDSYSFLNTLPRCPSSLLIQISTLAPQAPSLQHRRFSLAVSSPSPSIYTITSPRLTVLAEPGTPRLSAEPTDHCGPPSTRAGRAQAQHTAAPRAAPEPSPCSSPRPPSPERRPRSCETAH